ncbi:MAG: hypothetical protein MZV65_00870 [Chromatiales bacterium]|nr:hypothetical protein [Chromatiales bacterium]
MHLDGAPIEVDPKAGSSRRLQLAQRWAVVIATLNRAELATGAPARLQAGALAWSAIGALHDWRPLERAKPLDALAAALPPVLRGRPATAAARLHPQNAAPVRRLTESSYE